METYHGISQHELESFNSDLTSLAEHCGLPGARKLEVFVVL
jgi:hypothetical protein